MDAFRSGRADSIRGLEETIPAPNSNLEAAAPNSQLGAKMDRAIQDLPKAWREAFEKVVLEGKSYEQASHELGVPIGTAKSQVHRANSQLQGQLREYTDGQAGKADPLLLGIVGLVGTSAALGVYLDSDTVLTSSLVYNYGFNNIVFTSTFIIYEALSYRI